MTNQLYYKQSYQLSRVCGSRFCHMTLRHYGSLYAPDGTVIRGSAPLPLKIVHVAVMDNGGILISPWTEIDPRTGEKPWWV